MKRIRKSIYMKLPKAAKKVIARAVNGKKKSRRAKRW